MKGGFLLDVVVGECAAILQLFTSEDQTLLVGRDPLLVLNLLLDRLDGIRRLHIQRDGFAGQSLDENLHSRATTQTQHQVQGGLLLNVVVGKGPAILELLASKNQTLLVRGDAFFVLNFLLDSFDSVGRFDVQSDCLAGQRLDKDLHPRTTAKAQYEM